MNFIKNIKFKIKKKISLVADPFLASYALMFDNLKKIPSTHNPLVLVCYLINNLLLKFHKKNKNKSISIVHFNCCLKINL